MSVSRVGFPRKLRKSMKLSDIDYLKDIKLRLIDAKNFRRETREKAWEDNEKRYLGKHWPKSSDAKADQIVVNKTFSTIETIVPFVTGGELEFVVEAYSGDANSHFARFIGIWLNRLWRTNDMDGEAHLATGIWDSLVYGDGYVQPNYEIITNSRRGPDGVTIPQSEVEYADFMVENVSPWDVWIDRFATGLRDARYYFRRYLVPLDLVEDDKRYFFPDLFTTVDSIDYFNEGRYYRQNMREGERRQAVFYEYYDADQDQLVVFSEHSEYPHMWFDSIARNLVQIPNHKIPGLPYHMSDIEQITNLQDELNKTRSQMITQRRRNTTKVVVDKNAFDQKAMDALQSSVINEAIMIDGASGPISDLFQVIQPPGIPEDVYNVAAVISGDIDEITGVNDYMRGVSANIRRTATESSIIEGSSNTKIRHKLKIVERAAREVGQIILELAGEVIPTTATEELALYLTGEEAMSVNAMTGARLYDEAGAPMDALLKPAPPLFKGKYEVFVQQGSTELRSPQVKLQKMMDLFSISISSFPILAQAGVVINLATLYTKLLEAAGITDVQNLINDPASIQRFEQMQIQQALLGQSASGGGEVGQPAQQAGQPNAAGAQPPKAQPNAGNSGMLPPAEMGV